jgi:hypothetical protein
MIYGLDVLLMVLAGLGMQLPLELGVSVEEVVVCVVSPMLVVKVWMHLNRIVHLRVNNGYYTSLVVFLLGPVFVR